MYMSQTVCGVSKTSLCDIFTPELREHGVDSERRTFQLMPETSGRKIRGLCVSCQGVHPTVVLAASIQKENFEFTQVLERIVSAEAMANHAHYSSDHSSDTVTDVTDLADPFGLTQQACHRR